MKYLIATAAILGVSCLLMMVQFTNSTVAQVGSGSKSGSNQKASVTQPVELGTVAWERDIKKAIAKSREQNKPIALLFQEVPG